MTAKRGENDTKPENHDDAMFMCKASWEQRRRAPFEVSELALPLTGEVIWSKSNLPGMMLVDLKGLNIGNSVCRLKIDLLVVMSAIQLSPVHTG